METAHCGVCEWSMTVEEPDDPDLSRAMIDHFVETGHSPVERGPRTEAATGERARPVD